MAKQNKSYNESIAEIESIIEKINSNDLDIDELSTQVKKAAELIKNCKEKLHKTEEEIQKIIDEIKD